jgi:hypothetical protein
MGRQIMTAPAILGSVATYEDLHYILRLRADSLDVSRETIDQLGHFADGYASKVLRNDPKLRIGWWCMGDMLAVLGLRLVVIEHGKAAAKLKKRNSSNVRNGRMCLPANYRFLKQIASIGGIRRAKKLTPARRSEIGRMGAQIRWRKAIAQAGDTVSSRIAGR